MAASAPVKFLSGYYRINGEEWYGNVKRMGREWHAEIRRQSDGGLVQYAGIWNRKADAVEEVQFIINRRDQ